MYQTFDLAFKGHGQDLSQNLSFRFFSDYNALVRHSNIQQTFECQL